MPREGVGDGVRTKFGPCEIAPQATSVCKIIDYREYRFEQTKREKEAENQRVVEIKSRLSLNIDTTTLRRRLPCHPILEGRQ
ncbi:MAG: hypothetical protein ACLS8R_00600 [Anaeromassilibacillus sp.]